MTIDEAIEILDLSTKKYETASYTDWRKASQLGIEALKRIRRQRSVFLPGEIELLPGEKRKGSETLPAGPGRGYLYLPGSRPGWF